MLDAQKVNTTVAETLRTSGAQAIALINIHGVVLESCESNAVLNLPPPSGNDEADSYTVSPHMATKLHALLAAELFKKNVNAEWVGAQTKNNKLCVKRTRRPDLLLLAVSQVDTQWETVKGYAETAVKCLDI